MVRYHPIALTDVEYHVEAILVIRLEVNEVGSNYDDWSILKSVSKSINKAFFQLLRSLVCKSADIGTGEPLISWDYSLCSLFDIHFCSIDMF